MERSQWSKRNAAVGILVLVGLGLFGAMFHPRTREHIDTANNIIRSYRCPVGGYPAGRNARGGCICLKCPAGYRCPGGFHGRVACGRGTYQNRKGQNSCRPSPPGHYVPRHGASGPSRCPRGRYQPRSGQSSCIPASYGNFVPSLGMRHQVQCHLGQYQDRRGQAGCKPARRGTFVNRRGQRHPTPCHYGTYQDRTNQRSCKKARPGRFVNRRGAPLDSPCPRNQFQHCTGQMNCIPCPRGSYASGGARRCSSTPLTLRFVDTTNRVGSSQFRFLALAAPRSFRSVTFSWNRGSVTVRFLARGYTPFGNGVGMTRGTPVQVIGARGHVGALTRGRRAQFCKLCASNAPVRYGDTCWGIVLDNHRHCGCNSGGWTGTGMYYGGWPSRTCNRCACWGGGFSGYAPNRHQKGGVNTGLRIVVNK